jgi:prevent-host-death family protein
MAKQVSVRMLNQQTSAVLAEVSRGQTVTVTSGGKPIARIVPITSLPEGLQRLIEAGQVIPATHRGPLGMPPPTPNSGFNIADAIAREREESPW